MRGQLWKTGWAAMAASFLSLGSALADLDDDQRREAILMGVEVEDDSDLRTSRILCDNAQYGEFSEPLERSGTPMPPASAYCRVVLREEASRDRLSSYRGQSEHAAISNAVRSAATVYVDRQGAEQVLACERAYDAGYQAGVLRPDIQFQEALRPHADQNWRACYDDEGLHPALGFVAGLHNAQSDFSER